MSVMESAACRSIMRHAPAHAVTATLIPSGGALRINTDASRRSNHVRCAFTGRCRAFFTRSEAQRGTRKKGGVRRHDVARAARGGGDTRCAVVVKSARRQCWEASDGTAAGEGAKRRSTARRPRSGARLPYAGFMAFVRVVKDRAASATDGAAEVERTRSQAACRRTSSSCSCFKRVEARVGGR